MTGVGVTINRLYQPVGQKQIYKTDCQGGENVPPADVRLVDKAPSKVMGLTVGRWTPSDLAVQNKGGATAGNHRNAGPKAATMRAETTAWLQPM